MNTTIEEARTFAAAMAGFTGTAGVSKGGYIKELVISGGRRYIYVPPEFTGSSSGKMSVSLLAEAANRISKFANINIVSESDEKLSGEELRNIQLGLIELKASVGHHGARVSGIERLFLSVFIDVNYKTISENIKVRNYEDRLLEMLAKTAAKIIDMTAEREVAVNTFFESQEPKEPIETSVENVLMNKFHAENARIIQRLREFGINDARIESTIKASKAFQNRLSKEVIIHKDFIKNELCERLMQRQIAGDDLASHEDVRAWVKSYKEAFEPGSDRTCEAIIDELLAEPAFTDEIVDQPVEQQREMSFGELESRMTRLDKEEYSVLPGVTMVNLDNQRCNELRQEHFDKIVSRTGLSEERKNKTKFSSFLRRFMWNAFIANRGSVEGASRTRLLSEKGSLHARLEAQREMLDSGNVVTNLFYLYHYLTSDATDDPNVSKLREDIERSLPFAFEIGFLASRVGANEERKQNLSERIYQELSTMQPGQKLFLPIGCEGHATLLTMMKGENGRVEIQHFNTGGGLEGHQELIGDTEIRTKEGYPIAVNFEIDLTREGARENLEANLVSFMHSAHVGKSMEDVKRRLYNLQQESGVSGGQITASVRRKKTQQSRNCAYRCLLEGIRDSLGLESYRNFKLGLLKKLKEDYKSNSLIDIDDSAMIAGLSPTRANVKEKIAKSPAHP